MTQTYGIDVFGFDLGANIPSVGRSGDHLSPSTTVADAGESVEQTAREVTPDVLPEAIGGIVALVALAALAVAFGQLFTIEL